MGKGKPKIEVTDYYLSEHFGICQGIPDCLSNVYVKEKSIYSGNADAQADIAISDRELFGGSKKEGGVEGTMTYLPGEADQLMPDALAVKLGRTDGNDCPGYRGLASLFFHGSPKGFFWTSNTPYLPGVWVKLQRILKTAKGEAQWYSAKAVIGGADIGFCAEWDGWDYEVSVLQTWTEHSSGAALYIWPNGGTGGNALGGSVGDMSGFPAVTDGLWHVRRINIETMFGGVDVVSTWNAYMDVGLINTFGEVPQNKSTFTFFFRHWTEETATQFAQYVDYVDNSPFHNLNPTVDVAIDWRDFRDGSVGVANCVHCGGDMNPAHIVRECLVDTTWGMGTPEAAIDDTAFTAAADTLYTENFGLSMLWTRQTSIQNFIQEVLDHIQGVLYVDPATGLLTLTLVRDDYDAGTLDIIDEDSGDLTSFSRKLWGDIVNEIVVTWTNPENEQEETVTVQDDGSIAIQGGIISDSRNYYGVRNATLAQTLAMRDLRSAGQPLATVEIEVDRSQWTLRPASVVKLSWAEYGLSELVMRVQSVDYGKPGDPTIKLSMIEDVYGLDVGSYTATPPSSAWTDPSADPTAMDAITDPEIITLPLLLAANSSAASVGSPAYPDAVVGILATSDNDDAFGYELWDELTGFGGTLSWQSITENNIIGRGVLAADLDAEVTSTAVDLTVVTGKTEPTIGGFVIIGGDGEAGNEWALITAAGYTLRRGCLDTIPRAWPAGTAFWVLDESTVWEDSLMRTAGELVDYKLLMRTSKGLYPLADAALESATLSERPWLPNRPADVQAYGEAWSSEALPIDARARPDPWVTVTWANRNRINEGSDVLAWDDATMTPETGQTTRIDVCDRTGVLLASLTGLTGTSRDVTNAELAGDSLVRLRVYAERSDGDGDFTSLQYFEHWVLLNAATFDSTLITFDSTGDTFDEN